MHELTKKFDYLIPENLWVHIDNYITSYLKKKAEELRYQYTHNDKPGRPINSILGLESEGKEPLFPYPPLVQGTPQKPVEEKWSCECGLVLREASFTFATPGADGYFTEKEMKYCPQCGKARPSTKTLREVLGEKLKDKCYELRPLASFSNGFCSELADLAISVIENWKEERK